MKQAFNFSNLTLTAEEIEKYQQQANRFDFSLHNIEKIGAENCAIYRMIALDQE